MVEKGCFFCVCIAWELAVHSAVGEVRADDMGVAVDDGLYILIIYLRETVLLVGSFRFIQCGIFTLFLMMKFCAVDFCNKLIYFGSEVLVLCGDVHRLFLCSVHVCYLLLLCCKFIAQLQDSIGSFIIGSD